MDFQRQYQALYEEALALKTQGRAAQAQELEAQAARLLQGLKSRAQENPDDPQTAVVLLFLAERDWAVLGDHPDVQSQLARALAIREGHFGPNGLETAEALSMLAEFHFLAGRWGESEPLYRRAISIFKQNSARRKEAFGKSLGGLAQALAFLGRRAEADPYFAEAIALTEGPEGDKRVLYFLCIYRAEGLDALGRPAEAEALRLKANALLPGNNPGSQGFHV